MKNIVCALLAAAACASPCASAEKFEVYERPVVVAERGEILSCVLVAGPNAYTFDPPSEMRQVNDAALKKISFVSRDYGTTMALQLTDNNSALRPVLRPDALRQQVKDRFPEARLVEESDCFAADTRGKAFDLEQEISNVQVRIRICFVPLPTGPSTTLRAGQQTAVFTLTASTAKFAACHLPFMTLVNSFSIHASPPAR